MKKIPTVFVRDWEGTLGPPGRFLTREPHPDAAWVFAGEGVATRKLDGTCCLVQDGELYKRHEVKVDKRTGALREIPPGFDTVYEDLETGAVVGWLPVGDGPEDRWHREALADLIHDRDTHGESPHDGTYELIGPKINGNPEHEPTHALIPHAVLRDLVPAKTTAVEPYPPRDYDGLRAWLADAGVEGIVWHHPDGRMAKIKGRDFGIERQK